MSKDNFFVIKNVARADSKQIRISGDLILKGQPQKLLSMDISESREPVFDKSKISPHLPSPGSVRWILPPGGSEFYKRIKEFAQDMGYATVEHEGFS